MPHARTGKIARLPLAVREKINQQLKDGLPTRQIAQWLNQDNAVKAVLKLQFDGEPISDNNLSEWRRGGFQTWQNEQAADATIKKTMAMLPKEAGALQLTLTDKMLLLYTAHVLEDLKALDTIQTIEGRVNLWREVRLGILAMRRLQFESLRMNDLYGQKNESILMSDEDSEERVRAILGIDPDAPRFNQETRTFEGPGADRLNAQLAELNKENKP
jgi:hypothetical protein